MLRHKSASQHGAVTDALFPPDPFQINRKTFKFYKLTKLTQSVTPSLQRKASQLVQDHFCSSVLYLLAFLC